MGDATRRRLLAEETGAIRKSWRGRIGVALLYPNRYAVGMSNLGFQAVYRLLNAFDDVVCERAFLPEEDEPGEAPLLTFESGRPVAAAEVVAFSLSFENDALNLVRMLARAGLAPLAADRGADHPLVVGGGVACSLNPEALAPLVDAFLLGEAECTLPAFVEVLRAEREREARLRLLARRVPGAYVPAFYRVVHAASGEIAGREPLADVPERIRSPILAELAGRPPARSAVLTPHTVFGRTVLIETGRGCRRGCRFCSAGFLYRPPRMHTDRDLDEAVAAAARHLPQVGLVGAAVSDHPALDALCNRFAAQGVRFSFSSLRADTLSPERLAALRESGVKTATLAPEAGSERLRRVIRKGLTEEQILAAASELVAAGIPNLKLYFMLGLPTETRDDAAAIAELVKRIRHRFLRASRGRGAIGTLTVSVNAFVPKPVTPFQWAAMAETAELKDRLALLERELRRVPNVRLHADVPRWAYIQALLARGDRRVGELLLHVHATGGNWRRALRHSVLNADWFVLRERPAEETLPWDFIEHPVSREYLRQEYERAQEGLPGPACRPGEGCAVCGACPALQDGEASGAEGSDGAPGVGGGG